jgi:hypothetical protein
MTLLILGQLLAGNALLKIAISAMVKVSLAGLALMVILILIIANATHFA